MTAYKILFRVECSEKIGIGHLSRCCSLSVAFLESWDCDIYYCMSDESRRLCFEFTKGNKFLYISPEEIDQLPILDLIVSDIPDLNLGVQKFLKERSKIFVIINDEGQGPFIGDILIRPNLLGLPYPPNLGGSIEILQGKDFIILHPSYAKKKIRRQAERKFNIILCFGGSDPNGLTLKYFPSLLEMKNVYNLHVLVGCAFRQIDRLKFFLKDFENIRLTVNCRDMAEEFMRSDLVIVSGGTMLYEAVSIGVPAIIICQNYDQVKEAEVFHKQGSVLSLGWYKNIVPEKLTQIVKELMSDEQRRKQLSNNAKNAFGSFGTYNIINVLMKRMVLLR